MKRIMIFVLTFLICCFLATPAFATQITDGSDVVVKHTTTYEGEYRADVVDGTATAGGITVTGAPGNAVTLVIVPMEGEALSWIETCVDGDTVAAYDIHFLDANGSRINANGVKVSIPASGTKLTVRSVAASGTDKTRPSTVSGGKISFTADGSHYYAICGKAGEQPGPGDTVTVPIRGDENTVHADVTVEEGTVELHELDFEEIDHVVGDHVDTGTVEIDLTGLDEGVTRVVLPVATVEYIVEAAEEVHNDTEALQIDFPSGSVKMDDKTMRAIVEQAEGDGVQLVLENVGETRLNDRQADSLEDKNVFAGYEAYLLCVASNQRISDFEGGVATLSVPFTVPAGYQESGFAVWHAAENGALEKLTSWFSGGWLHWDVGHFSDFIVTYEGELPHEHSFTKYESNGDATCKKDGTETAMCDHGCGETDTRTDKGSRLDHDYVDGKCSRCGARQWISETGNIFLWIGILLLLALFLLFFWKRKKKDEA